MAFHTSQLPSRRPRVLYLGGLGRSGTTLLERIVGDLPDATSAGEVVHLWQRGIVDDELCGCGQPFGSCPYWQAVGAQAFGGWCHVDVARIRELRAAVDRTRHVPLLALPRLPRRIERDVSEYGRYYRAVYAAAAAVSGAQVVVDSSKHASLAFCLRWTKDIDLRIVHVVRDSRAVAYSWTKEVQRPESANGVSTMTRYTPATSAALWNGHNIAFDVLRVRGARLMLLRYEDLTADPLAALCRVAAFAGLGVPQGLQRELSDGYVHLEAAHTVAGNPMRFRTGRVDIHRDDTWRSRLPARDRRLVTGLTAPMLTRYRYLTRML